ncbi:hypothetical protein [Pseudomonas jessenii]|uniref:hypothetical protein n=1 Tax=Pseudomonas jessenii TaxID=77298 RepID=UPI00389276E4
MTNVKTNKIQVHGVPPKWDDAEFERRVAGWVNVYHNTTQCMENVRSPLPHDFLELVAEKVANGFTITRNQSVVNEPLNYSCWMIKPETLQQVDIADIRVKVKAEYVDHLQAERARYQDLIRQQLIQTAELKEQKKIDDAKAKLLAEIEKEVTGTFSELTIPA